MIPLFGRSRIMFGDEALPVLREGTVEYVGGKPQKSDPIVFTVLANVQVLRGTDLMLRPEGDRYSGGYKLYVPRLPGREQIDTNDKVLRDGVVYQVQICDDWGSYAECQIVELDVQDDTVGQFGLIDPTVAAMRRPLCAPFR